MEREKEEGKRERERERDREGRHRDRDRDRVERVQSLVKLLPLLFCIAGRAVDRGVVCVAS